MMDFVDRGIQTSQPATDRPSPFHTTLTSVVSDISVNSDESASVIKRDSLFMNSMNIFVRRSNTIEDQPIRRSSVLEKVRNMTRGQSCAVQGCKGTVNGVHGESDIQLHPRRSTLSNTANKGQSMFTGGLIGTSMDQRRPYRPLTKSSSRPAPVLRSITTVSSPGSGTRHCDACSVRDLQSWFQMNPAGAMPGLSRSTSELNPLLSGREKSKIFLLKDEPRQDGIGQHMTEVLLPIATVPKKGLIKLTSKNEDHLTDTGQLHSVTRRLRREPSRYLIQNKEISKGIRQSYNILMEKERLETEHFNNLINNNFTTRDLASQIIRHGSYESTGNNN